MTSAAVHVLLPSDSVRIRFEPCEIRVAQAVCSMCCSTITIDSRLCCCCCSPQDKPPQVQFLAHAPAAHSLTSADAKRSTTNVFKHGSPATHSLRHRKRQEKACGAVSSSKQQKDGVDEGFWRHGRGAAKAGVVGTSVVGTAPELRLRVSIKRRRWLCYSQRACMHHSYCVESSSYGIL